MRSSPGKPSKTGKASGKHKPRANQAPAASSPTSSREGFNKDKRGKSRFGKPAPHSQPTSHWVMGRNSVLHLLEKAPERVLKLMVSLGNKPDPRVQKILELAERHHIPLQQADRHALDAHAQRHIGVAFEPSPAGEAKTDDAQPHIAHQGILAEIQPRPALDLETFVRQLPSSSLPKEAPPVVIVLDEITDPQNLGAILRLADAFSVQGVVLPKHRTASLNAAAIKAACGAAETVTLVQTPNLSHALEQLKTLGYWAAAAATPPEGETQGKAKQQAAQSTPLHQFKFDQPTVLVMGSEGSGIRPLVLKHCDFFVTIDIGGTVGSLNVASATSIFLYEARRQFLAKS